ncbi:MAG TPA: EAL domain-containing protein [Acidimicrobiales bacterium]
MDTLAPSGGERLILLTRRIWSSDHLSVGQLRYSRPAAAVAVTYLAWAALDLGGDHTTHEMARAMVVVVSAGMVWACTRAARGSEGRFRRGWYFLAAAALCWLVSNGVAGVREVLAHTELAVPTPGDGASLLAVLLQVMGFLAFLDPAATGAGRLRRLTDGLLIASATVFIGWAAFLERAYRQGGNGPGGIVALAYPVSHVVLIALALTVLLRMPAGCKRPAWLLLAGQFALAVSFSAFAYLQIAARYLPGSPETFGWIVGALLLVVAAGLGVEETPPPASAPADDLVVTARGRLEIALPFAPVLVAAAMAAARERSGHLSSFLLVDAGVILLLLLVRQVLAQLDNLELAKSLDHRIKTRTGELHMRERQFRSLVQNATDVLTLVDAGGIICYQSDSVARVLGFATGALLGRPVADLLHPDERSELLERLRGAQPNSPALMTEMHLLRADGTWCWTDTTVSNLLGDAAVRGILLTSRDVGDRRRLEDELRRQALHDPLTGLGNRTVLYDRLSHAIRRASRSPQEVALLLLDLDGFKAVNDTLGHGAGDSLLVEVGSRLQDSVRPGDTVVRMGGDEFAILLEQAEADAAILVAQRVINRLRAPFVVAGTPIVVNGSVGIAHGSTAGASAEDLMRRADLAMYAAKARGKNRYQVFEAEMQHDARARVELETDLRRALSEGELRVHYQPLVDIPSGRIGGAEALVRWQHPVQGLIHPAVFIPVAEESDLVLRLGRLVLNEACRQARRFQELYPTDPPFSISVNVATRQLTSEWLVDEVKTALDYSGLDPDCLVLEITEGALMEHASKTIATIERLRALGVRLAIDDFGTGYSSLSRLRSFPVDELKIDRAFVKEIVSSSDEAPLVAAIVAMGHSLRLTIVAEGVETLEQLTCLHLHGVESVQGYLLSRPISADAFEAMLSHPTGLLEPVTAGDGMADGVAGLGGPDDDLSSARKGFMDVVSQAARTATQAPVAEVVEVVEPVLAELARVTGLDQVYLIEVREQDPSSGAALQVVAAHSWGSVGVPVGSPMPWPGSPGGRLLPDGGIIGDLSAPAPAPAPAPDAYAEVAGLDRLWSEFGLRTFVTVPVRDTDGRLVGALCGVSGRPEAADMSIKVLFELFAGLLTEHVGRLTTHGGEQEGWLPAGTPGPGRALAAS